MKGWKNIEIKIFVNFSSQFVSIGDEYLSFNDLGIPDSIKTEEDFGKNDIDLCIRRNTDKEPVYFFQE